MTPRHSARLALLVAAPLLAVACGGGDQEQQVPERPPVNVSVEQLEPRGLTETLELSGELQPWVEVEVSSELGGRVSEVGFREGERVAQGQLLARVGTDILEAALQEATALRVGAEAAFVKSEKLFERQAVPRQELIAATARFDQAKALEQQARLRVERSLVRAPIAGTALIRGVEPGEVLAPGSPVTTLHRLDRVKAVAGIPESDIAAFSRGGPAAVEVDAWPDERFEGRVHFLAPAAATKTRTFRVEVALDNADGRLRPGMIARVSLVRRELEGVLVVSRDVLQERDEGTVAVVFEDGVARVRSVSLGAARGNAVVVTEGLAAGERLIVNGHRGLVDGQRVAIATGGES